MTSATQSSPAASRAQRESVALAGLLGVAAAIRFAGIGSQSFWLDEVVTAQLMGLPFDRVLDTVPDSESTPYLYYVVLWLWSNLVGDGEAALRSLSAVFGVATVGAVWAAARDLASGRAAWAAGGLAALNPFLVWYSQEARAYALLGLLCALSFWCFARALRDPGWLKWWALTSSLAFATHYFAAFTIGPEAIVLVWMLGRTRALTIACAAIGAVMLAHIPLIAHQRRGGGADWIGDLSLGHRVAEIPKRFFAAEFGNQLGYVFWPVAILVCAAGVVLLVRATGDDRRAGLIALGIGAAGLLVPIAMALVTLDYVFARNLIGSLPPLLVALGIAATTRPGRWIAGAIAVLFVVALVRVGTDDGLQRDDWRDVAAQLDRREARIVIASPAQEVRTLRYYRDNMVDLVEPGLATREIVVVGLTRAPNDERPVPSPPPGFRQLEIRDTGTYRMVVFRRPTPVQIRPGRGLPGALEPDDAYVLADLND